MGGVHASRGGLMTQFLPKPTSVAEIARNVLVGQDYVFAMKEFIDTLLYDLKAKGVITLDLPVPYPAAAFEVEPPYLESPRSRAHLAGMAEHLAVTSGQPVPAWVEKPIYFLAEPFYIGGKSSRDRTVAETPPAFSRRLLFCGRVLTKLPAFFQRPAVEQ